MTAGGGYPDLVCDAASDQEGYALVERTGVLLDELPMMLMLFRPPA